MVRNSHTHSLIMALLLCWFAGSSRFAASQDLLIPKQVPLRRSSQLSDGFGVNLPLPREPRLPWSQVWWTRLFDSGVKWVRIGQYENSSDKTSWDWIEQTVGIYQVLPEVDEAIRSLAENGISIEMQLCYGNPLYQGNKVSRPKRIQPAPPNIGPQDHPPNAIFDGLKTEDEIQGFLNYTRFMVNRYKGRIQGWELWNEENIDYWQPNVTTNHQLAEKGKQYGKVLCRFADAVHEVDPESKVIFGGISSIDPPFVLSATSTCPSKIDVMAYHAYPGYGGNHPPEAVDALVGADTFREAVLQSPGIRRDIEFWDSEWNVIPTWRNSNESVQARYLPRYYLLAKAQHVKGFLWEFISGTDGNEGDQYGLLHGATSSAESFKPREAYRAFEVTSALFGQTQRDFYCEVLQDRNPNLPPMYSHGELREYCYRDVKTGKPIYAIWFAIYSSPEDHFQPVMIDIPIPDSQIQNPILIDLRTGSVTPAQWQNRDDRTIAVGVSDSPMAVADASYLNWSDTPETHAPLLAKQTGNQVQLEWRAESSNGFEIQRSIDWDDWQKIAEVKSDQLRYSDALPAGRHVTYRVRALGLNGPSPWSNPVWVEAAH